MEISTEFNLLSKITNARSLTGEDALTNKIAIELKALTLEGKLKGVWFHVPNESVVEISETLSVLRENTTWG